MSNELRRDQVIARIEQQIDFWRRRELRMLREAEETSNDSRISSDMEETAARSNAAFARQSRQALDACLTLLRQPQEPQWQPIETAPKDQYLLAGYSGHSASIMHGRHILRHRGDLNFYDEYGNDYKRPDAWMPLPSPPSGSTPEVNR